MREDNSIKTSGADGICDGASHQNISGALSFFDKETIHARNLICNGRHLPYNSKNVEYARVMRKKMTPAESKLWFEYLRDFKYRVLRQRPIDHFIADFYCAKLRLVIEVDGMQHAYSQKNYDLYRTDILKIYGLRIIRFTNHQVIHDFDAICRTIEELSLQIESSQNTSNIKKNPLHRRGAAMPKKGILGITASVHQKAESAYQCGSSEF